MEILPDSIVWLDIKRARRGPSVLGLYKHEIFGRMEMSYVLKLFATPYKCDEYI